MWDIYKAIYQKTKLPEFDYDVGTCIVISNWIAKDTSQTLKVKNILPYLFYIEPKHYIYLLYASITKKYQIPRFPKKKKVKEKDNKVYNRMKDLLGWSDRELKFQSNILDQVVDQKHWKKEFGIK